MSERTDKIFVIAEIAQAHDGSLGLAHAYIDAAAKAGADAVKFQTHIASEESTPAEPWRVKFSTQDKSRYDYWKRMEFSIDQWKELKSHADEKGIEFLSSPFSIKAVEILKETGVKKWKIASGETVNKQLIEAVLETGFPVLLSTGMSTLEEIDEAVNLIKKKVSDITVLQCTSLYPTPPEKTGLNMIQFFKKRYGCKAGLSDHSGTIYPGIAGAALGMDAIEAHLTLSRDMFGPDTPASLTTVEFADMVKGIRFVEKALSREIDKDAVSKELNGMRKLFTKSIVAKNDISKGEVITEKLLAYKKPGTGISPAKADSVIGKRAKRIIHADEIITTADLE